MKYVNLLQMPDMLMEKQESMLFILIGLQYPVTAMNSLSYNIFPRTYLASYYCVFNNKL